MKMKTVWPKGGTHPWIRQWTRMRESNSEKRRYVVDELDLFWINRIEKKRLLETEYHPICLSFVNPFIPSFVHSLFSSYFYHRIFIVTVRNSSCGKVMFSHVSVCPQSGGAHTPLGRHHHPWADTPWQTSPWADIPLGRHPPEMATATDGTHPTGMHSSFIHSFILCFLHSIYLSFVYSLIHSLNLSLIHSFIYCSVILCFIFFQIWFYHWVFSSHRVYGRKT